MEPHASLAEGVGAQPNLREFLLYFLRLGTLGFGGPIALAGHMQKDLVEDRKWISSQDYVEGSRLLSFRPAHLLPNSQCISVGYGRDPWVPPSPELLSFFRRSYW